MDQGPIPEQGSIGIRIVNLNTQLTRKVNGANEYNVYFDLSGNPSKLWRDLFDSQWRALTQEELWPKATIRGELLVMRSPLEEIRTTHLPALKRAVVATNDAVRRYSRERQANFTRRESTVDDERKTVEDLSDSLRFE
jgi:hypothetical protein